MDAIGTYFDIPEFETCFPLGAFGAEHILNQDGGRRLKETGGTDHPRLC